MRRIRRLHGCLWMGVGGLTAVWLILGFIPAVQHANLNDVYNVAAVSSFAGAFLFVIIYTVAGLTRKPGGPPAWWQTTIGTLFVLAAVSVMLVVGPVSFAVLFHHGLIDTWWWAWAYTGGHLLTAVVWLTFCWLRLIHPVIDGNGRN